MPAAVVMLDGHTPGPPPTISPLGVIAADIVKLVVEVAQTTPPDVAPVAACGKAMVALDPAFCRKPPVPMVRKLPTVPPEIGVAPIVSEELPPPPPPQNCACAGESASAAETRSAASRAAELPRSQKKSQRIISPVRKRTP